MIQALLVTISLVLFPYQGSCTILESGKVKDYEVVYPQKVLALPKRGIEGHEEQTKYDDTMKYEFKVNEEPVVLHLEKNKRLVSKDYTETHYSPDGREITTSPPVEDHCYYHGRIQNEADSTAAISTCDGLNGYFKINGEMYVIEPLKTSDDEAHAVFKYESLEEEDETPKTCGAIHSSGKSDEPIKMTSRILDNVEVEEEYLDSERYVELYMIADNLIYRKYSRDITAIRTRIFEILNIVNLYYRYLRIHVAVNGLEVWTDEDKIVINELSDPTGYAFADWRETELLKRKRNDNAQLLTGVHFSGGVLGIAFTGGMCHDNESIGIIQDSNYKSLLVAAVMIHEMGHNLGMDHDTDSCTCKPQPCIMAANLGFNPPVEFSSCSFWYYKKYLMSEIAQCLLNDPLATDFVPTTVCGNTFVEDGEECDCGTPEDCDNKCCDAATCKLKPGAKCARGTCCEECQVSRPEKLCRPARDECDLPEFCNGESAECPLNQFHKNGHPCRNNIGYCIKGTCPTSADQCIALFGPDAKVAPDECFENNTKGDDINYCKTQKETKIPCEPEDVKCGRLYCTVDSPDGNSCKYHFSKGNPDAGMVYFGTKCGEGMACNFEKCQDIETM